MPKISSMGSKFKRVEIAIRQTLRDFSDTNQEINKALGGKRTVSETKLLQSIQQEWTELHKRTREILEHLYDGVELRNNI